MRVHLYHPFFRWNGVKSLLYGQDQCDELDDEEHELLELHEELYTLTKTMLPDEVTYSPVSKRKAEGWLLILLLILLLDEQLQLQLDEDDEEHPNEFELLLEHVEELLLEDE